MEKKIEEENIKGVSPPLLGDPAPDFEAETTFGKLQLDDFRGSWVVLFSYPADFTPVSATEVIAFAEKYEELKERNTELLGLSVDSVSSHIAWVRNIEEIVDAKIPFPIIADLTREIVTKYGMIHPGQSKTETVRCVFVIDPKGILRAMLYYPLANGRNVDEIVRLIDAMQTSDKHKVATAANWRPGDEVVVPPPTTQEMAEERSKKIHGVDWYLCTKKL
jgi:peroxiredoxin (alkyl hydroperoxide reductase subunit C)